MQSGDELLCSTTICQREYVLGPLPFCLSTKAKLAEDRGLYLSRQWIESAKWVKANTCEQSGSWVHMASLQ